jgi:bifunctional non-homologous end joining protein LigD
MPRFSIQQHEAEKAGVHWDLRLEKGGVAKSWAIPKCKFPTVGEKVLAVEMSDHSVGYMKFEGTLPPGYGAGKVSVFDSGEYVENRWADDKVDIIIRGDKVSGRYVLVNTGGDNWLITKPKEQSVEAADGRGTVSTFLQSRIHESFTRAADQLYAMGFLTTEGRIALSSAIGDALETFANLAQEKVPNISEVEVPVEIAMEILRNAISQTSSDHVRTAGVDDWMTELTDLLALSIRVAADTGQGTPIGGPTETGRGEFTDSITELVKRAIGDEQHAIATYVTMAEALGPGDENRSVVDELTFDERVHERVLLRMLGNDLPILESPIPEPVGSATPNKEYDQLKERGPFFTKFTDLVDMALGDERHAIAFYRAMLGVLGPEDPNYDVIQGIMRDEQDHEKKLLRMLGEKTPEPIEAAKHSFDKCMECNKPPEYEVQWAEGMAHAWFCASHLKSWLKEGDAWDSVNTVKEVIDGKAQKNPIKNTNPDIKGQFIRKGALPETEKELLEELSELEHEQWMKWSKDVAKKEDISPERLERWKEYWKPYDKLPEDVKDDDREWAEKVLKLVQPSIPEVKKGALPESEKEFLEELVRYEAKKETDREDYDEQLAELMRERLPLRSRQKTITASFLKVAINQRDFFDFYGVAFSPNAQVPSSWPRGQEEVLEWLRDPENFDAAMTRAEVTYDLGTQYVRELESIVWSEFRGYYGSAIVWGDVTSTLLDSLGGKVSDKTFDWLRNYVGGNRISPPGDIPLKDLAVIYSELPWQKGYGGPRWGEIAEAYDDISHSRESIRQNLGTRVSSAEVLRWDEAIKHGGDFDTLAAGIDYMNSLVHHSAPVMKNLGEEGSWVPYALTLVSAGHTVPEVFDKMSPDVRKIVNSYYDSPLHPVERETHDQFVNNFAGRVDLLGSSMREMVLTYVTDTGLARSLWNHYRVLGEETPDLSGRYDGLNLLLSNSPGWHMQELDLIDSFNEVDSDTPQFASVVQDAIGELNYLGSIGNFPSSGLVAHFDADMSRSLVESDVLNKSIRADFIHYGDIDNETLLSLLSSPVATDKQYSFERLVGRSQETPIEGFDIPSLVMTDPVIRDQFFRLMSNYPRLSTVFNSPEYVEELADLIASLVQDPYQSFFLHQLSDVALDNVLSADVVSRRRGLALQELARRHEDFDVTPFLEDSDQLVKSTAAMIMEGRENIPQKAPADYMGQIPLPSPALPVATEFWAGDFPNAIGGKLIYSVTNPTTGAVLVPSGTVITEELVSLFDSQGVPIIMVEGPVGVKVPTEETPEVTSPETTPESGEVEVASEEQVEGVPEEKKWWQKLLKVVKKPGEEVEAVKLPGTEEEFFEELISLAARETFRFDPNSTQNEGRWRLIDPKVFDQQSIRRWNIWKDIKAPGMQFIMGKDARDNEMKPQAIRFDKKPPYNWTEEKAASWWKKNKGEFEKTWTQAEWDEWIQKRPGEVFPEYEQLNVKSSQLAVKLDMPKTLAVDLDGTILEYDGFKGMGIFGEPKPGAKETLQRFKDDGWYIVVDTCRGEVPQIVEHLTILDIPFDTVNTNPFQPDAANSRKPMADYRVDDSAIFFNDNWEDVYNEIQRREQEKYSPLSAIKVTSQFAYDPQRGILFDMVNPFGHRTQPQDYPDPVYWGKPIKFLKKRKKRPVEVITSSVLDYPRGTLDPAVWGYEEGSNVPKLRSEVKETIIKEFRDWTELAGIRVQLEDWVKEFLIIGSTATTQWKETCDIDVSVVINTDVIASSGIAPSDIVSGESVASWLGIQVALGLNGYKIAQHPVNYWVESSEKPIDMADAVYNLDSDTWIKPPPKVPEEFDPEKAFADIWKEAKDQANGFDVSLGELKRDIADFVALKEYRGKVSSDMLSWVDERLEAKSAEIADDVCALLRDFRHICESKEEAFSAAGTVTPEGRLYFSRNWLPAVLVWKWLDKYQYLKLLKEILHVYKEEPKDIMNEEKIQKLRGVLS